VVDCNSGLLLFTEKLRTFVVLFADGQHEGPQQPPAEAEVEAGLDQAAGQLQQPQQQQLQQPSSPASSTGSDSADTVVWTEEEMAAMRQERIAADVDWLDQRHSNILARRRNQNMNSVKTSIVI
jgi:hypothetical protein